MFTESNCIFVLVPRVAPEVVSIIADQRSINVSWMMLDCQDHHGKITMYEVYYSVIGDSVNLTLNTTNADETSLLVDGLEEFTNFTIQVRAYTAVGPGPYSAPMDVQTLEDCKHNYCVCLVFSYVYVCAVCVLIVCVYVFKLYMECYIPSSIVMLACLNSSEWSS